MADSWFRQAFGAHYPLLYAHRDAAEAARCLDLLRGMAPWGDSILDLGCGDGRHLGLLNEAGVRTVGLDLSANLLERARISIAAGDGPALVRGDMRFLPFLSRSFSAVFSLFTAFGYFGPPMDNDGPVREISRVLEPGGHWFLDFFDGEKVRAELKPGKIAARERELGPLMVREERRYVAESSQVEKSVFLRPRLGQEREAGELGIPAQGTEYTEQVAVFTLDQLDELAREQGLKRVASAGDYNGQALGKGSRWILVFQKVPEIARI